MSISTYNHLPNMEYNLPSQPSTLQNTPSHREAISFPSSVTEDDEEIIDYSKDCKDENCIHQTIPFTDYQKCSTVEGRCFITSNDKQIESKRILLHELASPEGIVVARNTPTEQHPLIPSGYIRIRKTLEDGSYAFHCINRVKAMVYPYFESLLKVDTDGDCETNMWTMKQIYAVKRYIEKGDVNGYEYDLFNYFSLIHESLSILNPKELPILYVKTRLQELWIICNKYGSNPPTVSDNLSSFATSLPYEPPMLVYEYSHSHRNIPQIDQLYMKDDVVEHLRGWYDGLYKNQVLGALNISCSTYDDDDWVITTGEIDRELFSMKILPQVRSKPRELWQEIVLETGLTCSIDNDFSFSCVGEWHDHRATTQAIHLYYCKGSCSLPLAARTIVDTAEKDPFTIMVDFLDTDEALIIMFLETNSLTMTNKQYMVILHKTRYDSIEHLLCFIPDDRLCLVANREGVFFSKRFLYSFCTNSIILNTVAMDSEGYVDQLVSRQSSLSVIIPKRSKAFMMEKKHMSTIKVPSEANEQFQLLPAQTTHMDRVIEKKSRDIYCQTFGISVPILDRHNFYSTIASLDALKPSLKVTITGLPFASFNL